jgi:preprotein translocase subunit SecA
MRPAKTFQTVPITGAGADLGAVGKKRPTATWTCLVQDNPFGTDIDRAMRRVGRLLRGSRQRYAGHMRPLRP